MKQTSGKSYQNLQQHFIKKKKLKDAWNVGCGWYLTSGDEWINVYQSFWIFGHFWLWLLDLES